MDSFQLISPEAALYCLIALGGVLAVFRDFV
jgi:hypothetical protein